VFPFFSSILFQLGSAQPHIPSLIPPPVFFQARFARCSTVKELLRRCSLVFVYLPRSPFANFAFSAPLLPRCSKLLIDVISFPTPPRKFPTKGRTLYYFSHILIERRAAFHGANDFFILLRQPLRESSPSLAVWWLNLSLFRRSCSHFFFFYFPLKTRR